MITALKLLIRNKGLRQNYIAKECGIPYASLSKYCCGTIKIAPRYIPALAKILGVKERDLCQPQ